MKKIVAAIIGSLFLVSSSAALADPWHERHEHFENHERYEHREHHDRNNWVVPLLGGLIVGAVVADASRDHHDHDHDTYSQPTVPYRTITVRREHYGYYYTPTYSCTSWNLQYDQYGSQEYVRTCYEQ
jgi:hypothetical protein